jgi:uncharacterized protein (DUF302 family)
MVGKYATSASTARRLAVALGVVLVLYFLLPGSVLAQGTALMLYSKKGGYDDVRFDLQNAIISRGLTVDFNGQISKMLERTGADVGSTKSIYKQAEYFTFCSAKLSRTTMEADPLNVGFCPYVVFIYETAAAPGTIHVGYRRPQLQGSVESKAALEAVERLLDSIAKDAVK